MTLETVSYLRCLPFNFLGRNVDDLLSVPLSNVVVDASVVDVISFEELENFSEESATNKPDGRFRIVQESHLQWHHA